MYCIHCGKQIEEDSVFCQFCGINVAGGKSNNKSDESSNDELVEREPVKKNKSDLLWEQFVEVYDAKDEDKKRFAALSSPYVWELLERLAINAFEAFIQENKEELNKQPYKIVEALKNVFMWSVSGGYKLWLAGAVIDDKEELNKFKPFSLDKLIDEWKSYDFSKAFKSISDEMGVCVVKYNQFRLDSFMDIVPEAKELSNATVETLKTLLLQQTLNGYYAGKIENTFRK